MWIHSVTVTSSRLGICVRLGVARFFGRVDRGVDPRPALHARSRRWGEGLDRAKISPGLELDVRTDDSVFDVGGALRRRPGAGSDSGRSGGWADRWRRQSEGSRHALQSLLAVT
jgi:hypothetical protein